MGNFQACSNPDKNPECQQAGEIKKGRAGRNRSMMFLCPNCDKKRNTRLREDRAVRTITKVFDPNTVDNSPQSLTRTDNFIAGHQKEMPKPEETFYQPSIFE